MQNLVNRIAMPEAHLGKNAFDVSQRHIFSAKLGLAQPVVAIDTVPDGQYNVDCGNLLRTAEIQTAAFARMKQNLDFYYVPYSQLYARFDDILYTKEDNHRRANRPYQNVGKAKVPEFSLTQLIVYLYGEYLAARMSEAETVSVTIGSVTRTFQVLTSVDVLSGETSYIGFSGSVNTLLTDIFGDKSIEDVLRFLDMLGYGNWLPFFKNCVDDYIRTYGASSPETIQTVSDAYGIANKMVGLYDDIFPLDGFDYDSISLELRSTTETSFANQLYLVPLFHGTSDGSTEALVDVKVNIMRCAAYQKIWCDYYRNSVYDTKFDSLFYGDEDYSSIYNFDWYNEDSTFSDYSMFQLVSMYFVPRYRQWKKDLFTGLFPDAQYGDVAVANINSDSAVFGSNSSVVGADLSVWQGNDNRIYAQDSEDNSSNFLARTSAVGISAIAIRYAEALQRYKERIIRAGNKHKDLSMAEYGVVSRYELDDYSVFLGSMDARIDINTVTATAESENVDLGQLGANGVSSLSGKTIKFSAKEHGVIIGIYSILPEAEYENYGLDKLNTRLTTFDWYHPAFANLGFAPVYRYEFNMMSPSSTQALDSFDETLGFTARDHEYKTSVDKTHGEFYCTSPVESGSTNMLGAFADYVTPRSIYDLAGNKLRTLYVDPHACDRIFYAPQTWRQLSDHFKVNMYFQIHNVLPMPVSGLPSNS